MKADLHVHTNASVDSDIRPEDVIEYSLKAGLGCVAITDHDTIKNAVLLEKMNKNPSLKIIVGSEITTDKKVHIIGLFLKAEVKSKDIFSVIREIKCQGGLVVLPHPFRRESGLLSSKDGRAYTGDEIGSIVRLCDIIEIANAGSTPEEMARAKEFFRKYKKPYCAGSDAHYPIEIGAGYTALRECRALSGLKKELLKNNAVSATYKTYPKDVSFALSFMQRMAQIFKKMDWLYVFGTKKMVVSAYGKIYNRFRKSGAKRAKREKARI